MNIRFPAAMEENHLIALLTLLDPRFKKVAFSDRNAAERAQRAMMNEAAALHQPPTNLPVAHQASDTDTVTAGVWQYFDHQVQEIASHQLQLHLLNWRKPPLISRMENPLPWWNENKYIYPTIANVACKYLCTLATSVPSERLFSEAGEVISQKRNRIKPKNVDMMLFLNAQS